MNKKFPSSTAVLIATILLATTLAYGQTLRIEDMTGGIGDYGDIDLTGIYKGKQTRNKVSLELFKDSTYKQRWISSKFKFASQGKWNLHNDTIILNPQITTSKRNKAASERTATGTKKLLFKDYTLNIIFGGDSAHKCCLLLYRQ